MEDMQILFDQMAADIASQALRLESTRLVLFLEWLVSHSSKVRANKPVQMETNNRMQLKSNLKAWFQSLPVTGLLWEYRLLQDEIAWWRDLDSASFALQVNGESKE